MDKRLKSRPVTRRDFLRDSGIALVGLRDVVAIASASSRNSEASEPQLPVVIISHKPSALQILASRDLQRYLYLRLGHLANIANRSVPATANAIVIMRANRLPPAAPAEIREAAGELGSEQYVIRTLTRNGHKFWWIVGGDEVGTLYGAYRFVEHLGVRFYLHGDVIPDERLTTLPDVNEVGKPLFDIRGINPFHDFPIGPDWWTQDDYLTYIGQLPKMRMNFIGLHCYPEGGAGPEALVWLGPPAALDEHGHVRSSYPAFWQNTGLDTWGYHPARTSEFSCGAALIFPEDTHGPTVMKGFLPKPHTPSDSNELFERTSKLLRVAFNHARALGIKTCVGTETPLTIPKEVKERLGVPEQDPGGIAIRQSIYRGTFQHIVEAHPLDYYWLWTPEDWTHFGNKPEQFNATVRDIQTAYNVIASIGKPFQLALSGWVLGPVQDRGAVDNVMSKDVPLSCLNRIFGHAPIEPAFANIQGRPKWAIPWLEDDQNILGVQSYVGRIRTDAVDARRLGCTGLIGIHWRTKMICRTISALAQACWDQSWVPGWYNVDPIKPGPFNNLLLGPRGGESISIATPVEKAKEPLVYQTVRQSADGYNVRVPEGVYEVTLKFVEPTYDTPGKRIFGVRLQGNTVLDQLDIFEKAGKYAALDYTFRDVRVTNGWLILDFIPITGASCIAGLIVRGQGDNAAVLIQIDCGAGVKTPGWECEGIWGLPGAWRERAMPTEDFFREEVQANFGEAAPDELVKILAAIDGFHEPEPSLPLRGGIMPDLMPGEVRKREVEFIHELETLRPSIRGAGNLERFDCWLNFWRYNSGLIEVQCCRGALDRSMEDLLAATPVEKAAVALRALALRLQLARTWEKTETFLLASTTTPGEIGTVSDLEQKVLIGDKFITAHDSDLQNALGSPLPPEATVSRAYSGTPRVIIPTVRTLAANGAR